MFNNRGLNQTKIPIDTLYSCNGQAISPNLTSTQCQIDLAFSSFKRRRWACKSHNDTIHTNAAVIPFDSSFETKAALSEREREKKRW